MRAYTHRFIAFAIQCIVILLLGFVLSFSASRSLAQDVATDTPAPSDTATVVPTDVPTELPTVVPTDVPTEAPTDVPTEAPTAEVTSPPTEAVTEQPSAAATDATATDVPAETATQAPATPVSTDVFTADFQDGNTSAWLLTAGWVVSDEAGNKVLTAGTPNETATLSGLAWPYFTMSFRVRGDIQLNMASGGSNYQIKVASDGAASLYKDGALLGQAAGLPPTDATVEPAAQWHIVNLLAPGNILAVKVDNFTPISTSDVTLTGMGPIMFGTTADNTANIALDDVHIQRLDAPPPAPTAEPTSGTIPIPPPTNATAEPTVESTAEATLEATVEVTPEVTVEATVEATAEATIEATAEATAEPRGLSEAALKKLPPELVDILQNYAKGDMAGANAAAADYFINTDQLQRIDVTIWAVDEPAAAQIAGDITASNGVVTDAFSIRLQALVTLDGLLTLANAPEVALIEVQPHAVSTSDMQAAAPTGYGLGTEISEGVDTTGAAAWQNAGIKGAGVGIAVMDTGFGASVTDGGEYACLFNNTVNNIPAVGGDSTHGLLMVQVLCDMAPAATVYMYKANTAANLASAINSAASNAAIKVIVIAMDLGASVSPGDGTGGGANFANGLYKAIADARNPDTNAHPNYTSKIVIASAGNNTGRYVTLNYSGSGTVTVPINVFPGDTIHVSWNDWSANLNGPALDDFTGTIDGGTTVFGGNRSLLPAPATAPHLTHVVTGGVGGECTNTTIGCAKTLTLNHTSGENGPIVLQVQITGSGTINTPVTGATVNANAGNIARPADSQDVISVGAVCPDGTGFGLFLDDFSSHGPVFAVGGGVPSLAAPFTRDQVKPDLASQTHVSTLNNRTSDQDACDPTNGFNGTSAAAAHVAGMVALMVSNTNNSMSAFDGTTSTAVDAVQDYLQTHSIDNLSVSGFAVGYDMSYGSGYSVLGNPNYDLSQITAISSPPNQLPASCPTALYVGLNNPGSSQDGTLANPFIDINEALGKALSNQCVVLLPGEYVAPIFITSPTVLPVPPAINPTVAPAVLAYNAVNSVTTAPSMFWLIFASPIIAQSSNGIVIDGITANSAYTLSYANGSGSINIFTPALRIFGDFDGVIVQNSTFSGFKAPGNITDSTNTLIKGNTFRNFVIPQNTAPTTEGPTSPAAVLRVDTANNGTASSIVITNNIFQNNTIGVSSDIPSRPYAPSIIGVKNARLDIFYNRFIGNTTMSVIGVNQWIASTDSTKNTTDEVRIFDNVFSGNTNLGPLVHLFQAPKVRFVNNTVVNNSTNPSENSYNGYLVYGNTESNGTQISNRLVEIHNNLFYNNGAVGHPLIHNAGTGTGCESIDGGIPVRNNWFTPSLVMVPDGVQNSADECRDVVIGNTTTVKSSGTNNETITDATFFGIAIDPNDPYRLRPNTNPLAVGGINSGDDTAVTAIFGNDLSQVKDLIGELRQITGRNDNPNPPYNGNHVDIGAYELGVATPPVIVPIPLQTIPEDSAPVVFKLAANGGYSRTFAITAPPTNYDPKLTNACGGQPVAFSAPNTVTYCPPPNFHTKYGNGGADVPVTIGFSVEDKVGNPGKPDTSTITINITPVNDPAPTPQPINAITDYGSPLVYQLGPAPTFDNFNLAGAANGLDYPVTFAFGTQTAGTTNANLFGTGGQTVTALTTAFNNASSNGGQLILNPVGGQIGRYNFTYSITEVIGGQSASGTGSITVVPAIAKDGHYDDDSFYISYNTGSAVTNGWTPSYVVPAAYNHTLHSTRTALNQLEFPFTGTVASLNMLGSATPSLLTNKLKVEFNLDVSSPSPTWVTYTAAKTALGNGFSCINTLNNLSPTSDAVPNDISTISNYSAVGAAYKLICSGFPVGGVQAIRLTNNLANSAMTIDSMDVGSGIFGPGFYQESDINVAYSGTWVKQIVATASGGTRTYTTGASSSYSFKIKNAARFVLFTSPGPTGGTMHVCITPSIGSQTCSDRSDNHAVTTLWQQQQAFNGLDSALTYTVLVTNTSAQPTQYIDLDAIQVFAPTSALVPGLYQQDNAGITYNGSGWIKQAVTTASGGSRTYATGASNSYSFQVKNASRFTLYTSPGPTGGIMQVCMVPGLNGAGQTCSNRSDNASVVLWQQKLVFSGLNTAIPYTVTVTNVSTIATQYIDLDAIEIYGALAPLTPLTPGQLYQQENANIEYSGAGWKLAASTVYSGSSNRYTLTLGDSYKFQVFNAGRVVLYTTATTTGGTMQVCISPIPTTASQSCTTRVMKNGVAAFQQKLVFTGLDPLKTYTITVTNVASTPATPTATFIDLDAIEVLADVAPLTPSATLYQENNTNIIYNGFGWKTLPSTLASLGSYRSSALVGNYYTFKVSGADRFVLYVSPGPTGGSMSVCYTEVDTLTGLLTGSATCTPAPLSEYAAAAQWQQPRYITGLDSSKTYSVTVTSTVAGKYIDLDAIQVDAPLQPLTAGLSPATPGLYQQNDLNIRFTGAGWKTVTNALASGNNFRQTFASGNSYTFQVVNATRFALYTSVGTTGGTFSITCTDVTTPLTPCTATPPSINQYSVLALWQQRQLITVSGPSASDVYSVTVTNTSPVATRYIDLDAIEVLGAVAPLVPSVNLYQQDDTNITYTGAGWKTAASTLASGGNFKNTLGIGNNYSFKVSGADRFTLYRSLGPTGGIMSVCIAPVPAGGAACGDSSLDFSQYSAVVKYQQPLYFTGLDSGTLYTVTVTNNSPVATKYIDLDAIQVDVPLQPLTPTLPLATPGIYQQNDPNIRYTGIGWTTLTNTLASGSSYKRSLGIGDKYEFQVQGADRFVLYVSPNVTGGTMQVCINPVPAGYPPACSDVTNNRSDFAAAAQFQQPRFFGGLVPATLYTVTVTNVSPAPPAAAKYIDIDAIQVLAPAAALTPNVTPYQENDKNIVYSGTGWTRATSTLASGTPGAYYMTRAIGDSYSFQVSGADRFILYMSPGPTGGTISVTCTPTPCNQTSASDFAGVAQWQQPRLFTGLTSGSTYLVTVTNNSPVAVPPAVAKYIDLDAIEVLAPDTILTPSATLYQENNPNIVYSGTGWTRSTSTLASGTPGAYRSTKVNGDSYSFRFQGADQFVLYVSPGPTGGTMKVCYTPSGGSEVCNLTVSETAAVAQWQQPRYFKGLDSTKTYSVTVTNVSTAVTQYIDLDAIEIDAALVPLAIGSHEQNDPNIRYSGTGWKNVTAALASGTSYRSSFVTNDSYSFRVALADHFVLYVTPGPAGGTMNVCYTELISGVPSGAAPTCSSRTEYAAAALWQQPQFFGGLDISKVYLVTVTNTVAGKYIDLDAVDVLAPIVPLTPSSTLYQENDARIAYTGTGWTKGTPATASGNSFRSATGIGNSYTFQVSGATRFSLLTSPGLTGGMMSICYLDNAAPNGTLPTCVNRSNYAPVVARWQQAQIIGGLVKTNTYTVTVSNASSVATQYIDLDAIQIIDDAAHGILQPGWYQDTDLNLTYTGTWTQDAQTGSTGGQTTFTKTNNDEMRFTFHGVGFTVFNSNPTTGAQMELCYKISGRPDSDFTDPLLNPQQCTTTTTAANPAQVNVGTAVYGLKEGDYEVRVRNTSPTGTLGLYVDRIAILGTPSTTLTVSAVPYENTNPAIVYTPAPLWATQAPYAGGNITASASKGATAQIRFTGTTLIVYQAVGPTNSRNVLLCRVLDSPTKNAAPQCGSFSQNTVTPAYIVPIAFYGFGSGTNDVIIENRNQGGSLNIDKILIN